MENLWFLLIFGQHRRHLFFYSVFADYCHLAQTSLFDLIHLESDVLELYKRIIDSYQIIARLFFECNFVSIPAAIYSDPGPGVRIAFVFLLFAGAISICYQFSA